MDLDQLYMTIKNRLFTDLNLTIVDDHQKSISISLHKNILYSSAPYFRKLLTSPFKENNSNDIVIKVPYAGVVYDLIMNLFNKVK